MSMIIFLELVMSIGASLHMKHNEGPTTFTKDSCTICTNFNVFFTNFDTWMGESWEVGRPKLKRKFLCFSIFLWEILLPPYLPFLCIILIVKKISFNIFKIFK